KEGCRRPHLLLGVEAFEVEHGGDSMLADAACDAGQFLLGALRINDQMAVLVRKRDEVTLRVDHALLHPGCGLLQKTAQEVRLAGTGIALHQQASCKQLLKIDLDGRATRTLTEIDADSHPEISVRCAATGIASLPPDVSPASRNSQESGHHASRGSRGARSLLATD